MKKLHPNAVWLFFLQYIVGFVFLFIFLGFCIVPTFLAGAANSFSDTLSSFWLILCLGFFVVVALLFGLSYFFAKLTYDNYLYELKDNGFYKESGVITKKYVTIPYERIQNIDIYRGLLARILGLSDLQIQTAGMSAIVTRNAAYGMGAEGRLPGVSVEEANMIRDELVKRSQNHRQGM